MSYSIRAQPFSARSPKASGGPTAFSTVSSDSLVVRIAISDRRSFTPVLEHGSETHRIMTLDHLLESLVEFSTNEQGSKSVTKALKEGGKDTLDKVVKRMCEPAKG